MNARFAVRSRNPRTARRRTATWLIVLASCISLSSCGGKTDERIARLLPDPLRQDPPINIPDGGSLPSDASVRPADGTLPCGAKRPLAVEELPLALYIMVDRSQYMRSSELRSDKWNAAIDFALKTWVVSQDASALDLGLAYYPVDNGSNSTCVCQTSMMPKCGNCRDARVTCNPAENGPDVEIVAPRQHPRLVESIEMHTPAGAAALAPAWAASEAYLDGWQKANPEKKVVRVVIAGGPPWIDGCGETRLPSVTDAAAASHFRSYVISLDSDVNVLGELALSGTGGRVIRVDSQRNVSEDLFGAMQEIVAMERGCDFLVRQPLGVYEHLEVQLTFPPDAGLPAGLDSFHVEDVDDRQHCTNTQPNWYPDPNVPQPRHVSLCRNICTQLHQYGGAVSLETDCNAITPQ